MFTKSAQIIRILAFVAFTLSIFSIGWDVATRYNESVAEEQTRLSANASGKPTFGIYGDWGDSRRLKRLALVPLSLAAFFCIRRFPYLSLSIYGLSLGIFLVWFLDISYRISINEGFIPDKSYLAIALVAANPSDYALFGAILVLFASLIRQLMLGKYRGENMMGMQ